MPTTQQWPKKMAIRQYIARWYVEGAVSEQTIINRIRQGKLPGEKDGGVWCVWVLADGSPAYGYGQEASTGNGMADAILKKRSA